MHTLNRYEELLDYSKEHQIIVDEDVHFRGNLSGLFFYDDDTDTNNIALSHKLSTTAQRSCVLAEELGHYHTSSGIMMDPHDVSSRKQERHARFWAYQHMIGVRRLLDAYLAGCQNKYEIAEYLDITEEFLQELVDTYRDKYGTGVTIDEYFIGFIPHLYVMRLIK